MPGTILRAMRAGRDPHRGFARRLPAAAAIVAHAVFDVIGVVGVAGPILVPDVGIILRALVDIVDHQPDRRAGRHLRAGRLVDEHAGEDPDLVGLLPLRGEARLARPPLVEIGLDVGLGQRDARRAAVDHAADRRPVALAKGRDAEQMAEGIERHRVFGPVLPGVVAPVPAAVKWLVKGMRDGLRRSASRSCRRTRRPRPGRSGDAPPLPAARCRGAPISARAVPPWAVSRPCRARAVAYQAPTRTATCS